MADQDVFTLPTDSGVEVEAVAPKPKPAKNKTVEPEAPAPETDDGPKPPHPAARLVRGQWMLKRQGRTYIAHPLLRPDGGKNSHSIYQPVEFSAILDDHTPAIDEPHRAEAAILGSGCRMAVVALYDDGPVDDEIKRLRESGFVAMADLLRERHPQAERPPFGPLELGVVMASTSLHKIGSKVTGEGLRNLLRRHANGDYGDRGKLAEVELDDDAREFPGAFGSAVLNAVSIERGFGLVWSTFSGADVVDAPRWQDDRRLHVLSVLDGSPRTYVWAKPYDDITTG